MQRVVGNRPSWDLSKKESTKNNNHNKLSTISQQTTLAAVPLLIQNSGNQIYEERKKIDQSIQEFCKESTEMNTYCSKLATKIRNQILQGKGISEEEQNKLNFLLECAQAVADLYFETSQKLMQLQQVNSAGRNDEYKSVLDLISQVKEKRADLLKKENDIVQAQDDHELKVKTIWKNEQLKAKEQYDAQRRIVEEFKATQERRRKDNQLRERKMN